MACEPWCNGGIRADERVAGVKEKLTVCGWAQCYENGISYPVPVYAEHQVEIDGMRLGVCLAIAARLEKYPHVTMPGLRTGLTPKQQDAVERYRTVHE